MSNETYRFGAREAFVLVVALLSALVAIGYQTRSAYADGTFGFSSASYTVTEGDTAQIVINRTGGTENVQITATVTDGTAVSPTHYINPGPVQFIFTVPGSNTATLQVGTVEDLVQNVDRTFSVTLTVPGSSTPGITSAVVTIVDDDGPSTYSYQSAAVSFSEGTSNAAVTVLRSGSTANPQSVDCQVTGAGTATPGVDFTVVDGTANFGVGATSATCTFNILADAFPAEGENIVLGFTNAVGGIGAGGSNQTMTITITDAPTGTVQFSQSNYTVTEGVGTATFAVTRTGGSNGGISAFCSTTAGTADANIDYIQVVNQSLTWVNGETTTKFCQVQIIQDGTIESSEQFGLQLSGGNVGSPSTATVTINDDDGVGVLQFSSTTYTGAETGGAITITVTRTGSTTGQVTVDFATNPSGSTATAGVDYFATSGTLIWSNGDGTSKSFTVTPIADGLAEGTETVNLVLSNPTGGASLGAQSTAVLNITDSTTIPVITSIAPPAGPIVGGTPVTIYGANFTGAFSVTFGGLPCTSVSVVLSTQITCVTPAHLGGTVEVIVTTAIGSNTTVGTQNDYFYTGGPTVTFVSPNTGPATGNTIVTITGTGFTSSGMTVKFGAVTAVFTYIDTTTIVAVAPAQSAGTVNVVVTTPGGTSPNTSADDYTYTGTSVPVVTSVSPASGPIGTTIIITGTGFTGVTSVTVGGVSAAHTVNSSTQITATVPAGTPAGVVDVRVTGPGGTSANTAADNFTNTSAGQTVTYTLYFRFTLLVWTGKNNIGALAALTGLETPDNPQTNNVSASVGAIYRFNGSTQSWEAYFPGSDGVPGANNFTTLQNGTAYFIALKGGGQISWTVLLGP
ncbi:MAG: IPT/TIG domain-containing protein [Dehalococcoidia bacterium]|nr:IPT/TIG domain-containing protein [Dehalococcoidia bacterium]